MEAYGDRIIKQFEEILAHKINTPKPQLDYHVDFYEYDETKLAWRDKDLDGVYRLELKIPKSKSISKTTLAQIMKQWNNSQVVFEINPEFKIYGLEELPVW
jgi:hypothetical protein